MYILGIAYPHHDTAASLIKDGMVVAAAEEERFTRIKHDFSFPINAINYCLRRGGINQRSLEYVAIYQNPTLYFKRYFKYPLSILQTLAGVRGILSEKKSLVQRVKENFLVKSTVKEKLNYTGKIIYVDHHLSHAASTFFASPFKKSAIIIADGFSEWLTTTVGMGEENKIKIINKISYPHSLGFFYGLFTIFLGFKLNDGECKIMGLAPYGKPRYIEKIYNIIRVKSDGSFKLNMDYFPFRYCNVDAPNKLFNKKFINLFGKPRCPDENKKIDLYYADIAASIQKVLEDTLIKIANNLYKKCDLKQLCLAGGVFLNSVANGKILKETPFREVFIQPQANDAGGAIGAALYFCHSVLGHERNFIQEHAYFGPEYADEKIKDALDKDHIKYEIVDDKTLFEKTVNHLLEGKTIGWFQGRMEWGPRALGNRSILADPRNPRMKDILNKKVKFRENFRPFAPSILAEKSKEWLEIGDIDIEKNYPLKFMLYVIEVKKEKRNLVPAITHVDGTTRPQLVYEKDNPRYYRLIKEFYKQTGVPLLLNTSFNLRGEPIVCTPEDAVKTFLKSGLDFLILNNYLVEKNQ